MRAVWGPDPVSFTGDFYNIPESRIGPKPRTAWRHTNANGCLRSRITRARGKNRRRDHAGRRTKHHDREAESDNQQLSRHGAKSKSQPRRDHVDPESPQPPGRRDSQRAPSVIGRYASISRKRLAETQGTRHKSRILRHEPSRPNSNRHSTSATKKARAADQGLGMRYLKPARKDAQSSQIGPSIVDA